VEIRIFNPFAPVILTLIFIYELDPYSSEVYRMYKYELPTLRFLKVIVWQTDRHD